MKKYLFLLFISLLFLTCQNKSKQEITALLESFVNSQIVIPNNLLMKIHADKPLDSSLLTKSCKMIVYLNAKGCESCKMQALLSVYQFVLKNIHRKNFGVVIILNPTYIESSDHFLKNILFCHTVFYDLDGSFERLNPQLPKDERFHTFLLNQENKVILIGSPIRNAKLNKLYLAEIQKNHS